MRSLGHGIAHFEQFQGNEQLCPGTPKYLQGLSAKVRNPREETIEAPVKCSVMFDSVSTSSI